MVLKRGTAQGFKPVSHHIRFQSGCEFLVFLRKFAVESDSAAVVTCQKETVLFCVAQKEVKVGGCDVSIGIKTTFNLPVRLM